MSDAQAKIEQPMSEDGRTNSNLKPGNCGTPEAQLFHHTKKMMGWILSWMSPKMAAERT
jgi:hypothetical protein